MFHLVWYPSPLPSIHEFVGRTLFEKPSLHEIQFIVGDLTFELECTDGSSWRDGTIDDGWDWSIRLRCCRVGSCDWRRYGRLRYGWRMIWYGRLMDRSGESGVIWFICSDAIVTIRWRWNFVDLYPRCWWRCCRNIAVVWSHSLERIEYLWSMTTDRYITFPFPIGSKDLSTGLRTMSSLSVV